MRRQSGQHPAATKASGPRHGSRSGSAFAGRGKVTLEVMNPRGAVASVPTLAPTPRVTDLAGKRIALYWNGKAGADNFWDVAEELLAARFPSATILRYEGPLEIGAVLASAIAREADTVLYGIGD